MFRIVSLGKNDTTGPAYSIHCQGVTKGLHRGESIFLLEPDFLENRYPNYTSSEGIESLGHHIKLKKLKTLDREPRWFQKESKKPFTSGSTNPLSPWTGQSGETVQATK